MTLADAVAPSNVLFARCSDTASSDLRRNLFSMNDTVKAHFDSIAARKSLAYLQILGAHVDGLNGSLWTLCVSI